MKKIILATTIITVFAVGFATGKQTTIKSAQLCEVTNDGYSIIFDEEIHDYTY